MTEKELERPVSSLADKPSPGFPYNSVQWEQRLVVARAQREKALKQRAAQKLEGEKSKSPGTSVTILDPETRLDMARAQREEIFKQRAAQKQTHGHRDYVRPPLPTFLAEKQSLAASLEQLREQSAVSLVVGSILPAASMQVEPKLPRVKPHYRLSAGLIVACLVSAPFVNLSAMSFGFSEIRNRVGSLLFSPESSFSGVAPSVATVMTSLKLPAKPSFEDSITVSSISAPSDLVRTLPSAIERPLTFPPNRLSHLAFDDVSNRPKISSAPPALDAPILKLDQLAVTLPADDASGHERSRISSILSTPADAKPPLLAFVREESGRPPNLQVSQVAVFTPEQRVSRTDERTVAMLSENGWPAVQATTPYNIKTTHVRFYHLVDQAAAQELAGQLKTVARDFTGISPLPVQGYLEVWQSGRGAPSVRTPDTSEITARSADTPNRTSGAIQSGSTNEANKAASRRSGFLRTGNYDAVGAVTSSAGKVASNGHASESNSGASGAGSSGGSGGGGNGGGNGGGGNSGGNGGGGNGGGNGGGGNGGGNGGGGNGGGNGGGGNSGGNGRGG